jgi:hypothetical protein
MSNTLEQRAARIRAFCTGESYQSAVEALRAGLPAHGRSREFNDAEFANVKDGGESLLQTCPSCGGETLADTREEAFPKHLADHMCWFCISCAFAAGPEDVTDCLRCGQLTSDVKTAVCPTCVDRWMSE